jgi:hypothetical protein
VEQKRCSTLLGKTPALDEHIGIGYMLEHASFLRQSVHYADGKFYSIGPDLTALTH